MCKTLTCEFNSLCWWRWGQNVYLTTRLLAVLGLNSNMINSVSGATPSFVFKMKEIVPIRNWGPVVFRCLVTQIQKVAVSRHLFQSPIRWSSRKCSVFSSREGRPSTHFFAAAPVVINISKVASDIDFVQLKNGISQAGTIPVGGVALKPSDKRMQNLAGRRRFCRYDSEQVSSRWQKWLR